MHLFAPESAVEPRGRRRAPRDGERRRSPGHGVVLGLTLWLGRDGRPDVAVAAAITAGVLVVNLTQEHHLAMLLVPAVVSLARWLETSERRVLDIAWLALAFFLLAAPLAYEDPSIADGLDALLAYPRLYGAWLLWAVADPRPLARSASPGRRRRAFRPAVPSHEGAVAR